MPELTEALEQAVSSQKKVVKTAKSAPSQQEKQDVLAIPLMVDNQVCGAVGLAMTHRAEAQRQTVISQLEWGTGWLESLVRQKIVTASDRLVMVLELVATALQHERFQEAATAVATELSGNLLCERVSIGFLHKQHARVKALSHSASFSEKANIIHAIEAAMDEAIDQQAVLVVPSLHGDVSQVTRAHDALVNAQATGGICTVPFAIGNQLLGAITLEKPKGEHFDAETVKLCEHAAALLGPLLENHRKNDRWLIQKANDHLKMHLRHLFGPRHTGKKLAVSMALLMILFFSFADSQYRVTGDAILEGTIQRSIAVPFSGYVAQANVRAGDIVKADDILFSLDDRDLRLERLKWISQRSQRQSEYSEASAEHERAKTRILSAQIEQAEAQISLLEEQLKRLNVRAPFAGFVVAGDLSQSLGAPVERGDILFEIAPLHDYRVILNVNERDISNVKAGQQGHLALAGMPGEVLPIKVTKLTPISTAEEGSNFFQVEAELAVDTVDKLRPGMEGVGKINIDQRKLIWIWTHKVSQWLRMFFWSWWP